MKEAIPPSVVERLRLEIDRARVQIRERRERDARVAGLVGRWRMTFDLYGWDLDRGPRPPAPLSSVVRLREWIRSARENGMPIDEAVRVAAQLEVTP